MDPELDDWVYESALVIDLGPDEDWADSGAKSDLVESTGKGKENGTTPIPDAQIRPGAENNVNVANSSISISHRPSKRPLPTSTSSGDQQSPIFDSPVSKKPRCPAATLAAASSSRRSNSDQASAESGKESVTAITRKKKEEEPKKANESPKEKEKSSITSVNSAEKAIMEKAVNKMDATMQQLEIYKQQLYSLLVTARAELARKKETIDNLNIRLNAQSAIVCPECSHAFKEEKEVAAARLLPRYTRILRSNNTIELKFDDMEKLSQWLHLHRLDVNRDGLPTIAPPEVAILASGPPTLKSTKSTLVELEPVPMKKSSVDEKPKLTERQATSAAKHQVNSTRPAIGTARSVYSTQSSTAPARNLLSSLPPSSDSADCRGPPIESRVPTSKAHASAWRQQTHHSLLHGFNASKRTRPSSSNDRSHKPAKRADGRKFSLDNVEAAHRRRAEIPNHYHGRDSKHRMGEIINRSNQGKGSSRLPQNAPSTPTFKTRPPPRSAELKMEKPKEQRPPPSNQSSKRYP